MKGFAMLKIGATGWIEKELPVCGPMDAICKPIALAPCTSDIHTVWSGAIGDRHNMILGHEAVGEVVEVGSLVKDFKPGDRVLISAITPDWNSLEAQGGYAMHSGGMLSGWKFSNFKDGVFAEYFHVNDADGNLAKLPEGMDLGAAAMLADMVPTAEAALRCRAAIDEIVMIEGLEAEEEEINKTLEAVCRQNQITMDELMAQYDAAFQQAVVNSVLTGKVMRLIRDAAIIEE